MAESLYLRDGDELSFEPEGGWSWSGWNGREPITSAGTVLTLGGAGVRDTDLVNMFKALLLKKYELNTTVRPGIVILATVKVDTDTLCDTLEADGRPVALQTTTGTFEITRLIPSWQTKGTAQEPDTQLQKRGTWKVVEAMQKVGSTGGPVCKVSPCGPAPEGPKPTGAAGASVPAVKGKKPDPVIELEYVGPDNTGIGGAGYRLFTKSGEEVCSGTLDGAGRATVTLPPAGYARLQCELTPTEEYRPIDGYFDPPETCQKLRDWSYPLHFHEPADEPPPTEVWDWVRGVLLGGFAGELTTGQWVVRTVLTLIPVVDQIADVEDLAACIYQLTREGEHDRSQEWLNFVLSLIGCIPELGSLAKGVLAVFLKKLKGPQALAAVLKFLEKWGVGDALGWFRALASKLEPYRKWVEETAVRLFDDLSRRFSGVVSSWKAAARMRDRIEVLRAMAVARVAEALRHTFDRLASIAVPDGAVHAVGVKTANRIAHPAVEARKAVHLERRIVRKLKPVEVEGHYKDQVFEVVWEEVEVRLGDKVENFTRMKSIEGRIWWGGAKDKRKSYRRGGPGDLRTGFDIWGHVIARMFGGPDGLKSGNLSPMHGSINAPGKKRIGSAVDGMADYIPPKAKKKVGRPPKSAKKKSESDYLLEAAMGEYARAETKIREILEADARTGTKSDFHIRVEQTFDDEDGSLLRPTDFTMTFKIGDEPHREINKLPISNFMSGLPEYMFIRSP